MDVDDELSWGYFIINVKEFGDDFIMVQSIDGVVYDE